MKWPIGGRRFWQSPAIGYWVKTRRPKIYIPNLRISQRFSTVLTTRFRRPLLRLTLPGKCTFPRNLKFHRKLFWNSATLQVSCLTTVWLLIAASSRMILFWWVFLLMYGCKFDYVLFYLERTFVFTNVIIDYLFILDKYVLL